MSEFQSFRTGSTFIMFMLLATFVAGCGNGMDRNRLNSIDFTKGTLASCLKASGAEFAVSKKDLDFLSQAESEDMVSLFGSTFEESTKLFIDLWEDSDNVREWLMWSAQPFNEDKSPFEIVDSSPSESYVAYMLNPTQQERRTAVSCTR